MSTTGRTVSCPRPRLLAGLVAVASVALLTGLASLTTAEDVAVAAPGVRTPGPGPGALPGVASYPDPAAPARHVRDAGTPPVPRRTFVTEQPMTSSAPTRLRVPAIGVAADVGPLGLTDAGALEVPRGPTPAGWYVGSPTPGALGPAILAGHVSFNGTPGVFRRLAELQVGDRISVLREDGRVADFRVTRTQQYPKDRFPTAAVYGDTDRAGLRLITCGDLDAVTDTYRGNLVVFARLTGVRRG